MEYRIEGGKELTPDEKAQLQTMGAALRQALDHIQQADPVAISRIEGVIELLEERNWPLS
jgi:hypothetical protein